VVLVQSLHAGGFGHAWLRVREFVWTVVAFHVSKLLGYVPPEARFTMGTRRFYTAERLRRDVARPGCACARGGSGRCCRGARWWWPRGSWSAMPEPRSPSSSPRATRRR
jgi:hypothetical protein